MDRLERLADSIAQIPHIPLTAAEQYRFSQELLIKRQNELLQSRKDLAELLGGSHVDVMLDNHRNHVLFMANVLRYNQFGLLLKVSIWAYRSYHQHGFSYDYFRLALSCWQETMRDILPAQAAKLIVPLYQWLADRHQDLVDCAEDTQVALFSLQEDGDELQEVFLEFILHGNEKACLGLMDELIATPGDLCGFYIHILQPCLKRIGELWERGQISVALEHMASAIIHRLISCQYARHVMTPQTKGTAVIAAAQNELHDIGARIVSDILEMEGWKVYFVGANTPNRELMKLIRDVRPDLLGISVVVPIHLLHVEELIRQIRADATLSRMNIMVGGPAFVISENLWRQIGADALVMNGADAAQYAGGCWQRCK